MEQTAVKKSKPMLLMKSLLASYVLTALLLFLLAFLLYKFDLGESKVNLGITVIYILSCFLGGFLVGKGAGSRKFLWGMILGAIYAALLVGVTFLVEHQISGNTSSLVTSLFLCVAGGTLGGMLS
jgi:putative membrane protein (TIGR04086 family)